MQAMADGVELILGGELNPTDSGRVGKPDILIRHTGADGDGYLPIDVKAHRHFGKAEGGIH
jgi:hypothetical protein